MLNSIKTLKILLVSAVLVLFACSKEEEEKKIITTYLLTMTASVTPADSFTFTKIVYKNANGALDSLSNSTTAFSKSFNVNVGHNINFNVTGIANCINDPSVNIKYEIVKFEDNVNKGPICSGIQASFFGSKGKYNISGSFNLSFDGNGCK